MPTLKIKAIDISSGSDSYSLSLNDLDNRKQIKTRLYISDVFQGYIDGEIELELDKDSYDISLSASGSPIEPALIGEDNIDRDSYVFVKFLRKGNSGVFDGPNQPSWSPYIDEDIELIACYVQPSKGPTHGRQGSRRGSYQRGDIGNTTGLKVAKLLGAGNRAAINKGKRILNKAGEELHDSLFGGWEKELKQDRKELERRKKRRDEAEKKFEEEFNKLDKETQEKLLKEFEDSDGGPIRGF